MEASVVFPMRNNSEDPRKLEHSRDGVVEVVRETGILDDSKF